MPPDPWRCWPSPDSSDFEKALSLYQRIATFELTHGAIIDGTRAHFAVVIRDSLGETTSLYHINGGDILEHVRASSESQTRAIIQTWRESPISEHPRLDSLAVIMRWIALRGAQAQVISLPTARPS